MYSTITFQYIQNYVGLQDEPRIKKGRVSKRDVFYLTLSGLPNAFAEMFEDSCFKLIVGVLPSFEASQESRDYTACASQQKN